MRLDYKDESEKTQYILRYLSMWINPDMFKAMEKKENAAKTDLSDPFINKLREKGVSEEEIRSLNEDIDEVRVIKSPEET